MLTFKQHDTYPAIEGVLEELNEKTGAKEPINLTGAKEVTLVLKGTGAAIEVKCTITNAKNGEISVPLEDTWTKTAGTVQVEAKIEWGVGQYQTVPNEGYDSIVIAAFLGEAH